MNNQAVLRTESNGVEFFTVVATGESAVSEIGLSRMSGVDRQTMRRWFSSFAHKGVPKWLKPLQGIPLTFAHEIVKNSKSIKPIPAKAAFKFLSLVARNLKTDAALESLDLIGEIGLTSYIQSQTGWLPEEFKAAPKAHDELSQFLSVATEWDRGVMMVVDWEGYEVDMSDSWTFFDAVVFSGFTVDEFIKFEDETRQLGLQSQSKSEQVKLFFERNPDIQERLQPYTEKVERMLRLARKPEVFFEAYFEEYGCEPDDLYSELESSASKSRRHKKGYTDRTELADPRYSYDPEYMKGWNANLLAV